MEVVLSTNHYIFVSFKKYAYKIYLWNIHRDLCTIFPRLCFKQELERWIIFRIKKKCINLPRQMFFFVSSSFNTGILGRRASNIVSPFRVTVRVLWSCGKNPSRSDKLSPKRSFFLSINGFSSFLKSSQSRTIESWGFSPIVYHLQNYPFDYFLAQLFHKQEGHDGPGSLPWPINRIQAMS
jgi:hypothetical protein